MLNFVTFVAGTGNLADCDQQVPDVSAVEEHDVAVDCQLVLCTVDCEMSTKLQRQVMKCQRFQCMCMYATVGLTCVLRCSSC